MRVTFLTFFNPYAFGARCLAAYMEREGHEVQAINFKRFLTGQVPREDPAQRKAIEDGGHRSVFEIHPFYDLACPYPTPVTDREYELLYGLIDSFRPDVIGFSLTSSHLPVAFGVSRELRRRYPNVRQIFGGIHPTMDPEGCLEYADAVCLGEGEGALADYLADPGRTDIPNLCHRAPDGSIVKNPMRPLIQDLDSLPYPLFAQGELLIEEGRVWAFDDLYEEEVNDQLILSSQRGCPFSCSYCMHGVTRPMYKGQRYLRRKSVDRFLDEIAARVARVPGLRQLNFWDDILMIHPEWVEEFCEKYPKRIGLPFGGYAHYRTTTRPMMRQMKDAGCVYVSLGVQSGSGYINETIYNRHYDEDGFVKFVWDLADTGFDVLVYDLMSRCSFEREEDLRQTVKLLARLPRAAKISVKNIVYFPYTPINVIEAPQDGIPLEIYHFYEMLYLLAFQPGFDPKMLDLLVDDPHLRAHPEVIEAWVRQLAGLGEENTILKTQYDAKTRQYDALSGQMPWGVKRAAVHLGDQVRTRLTKTLSGPGER